jgi:cell division protein FtsB
MAAGKASQRGASRSSRSAPAQRRRSGGGSARTRPPAGAKPSPHKRKSESSPSAAVRGSSKRGRPSSRAGAKRAPARRPQLSASPWIPLSVIVLVVLLGWAMYPALKVQYQASRQYAGLQSEYETLKQRNERLRAQVADLKTPAGVERAARESLGFAKRGEHVYVVVPDKSKATSTSTNALQAASDGAEPITKLLDLIFGFGR